MNRVPIPDGLPMSLIKLELARIKVIIEEYGVNETAYWYEYRKSLEERLAELILLEKENDDRDIHRWIGDDS